MRMLFFLLLMTISFSSRSQYIDIPDATFKNLLIQQYPSCFNTSGQMDTTCSLIINETRLNTNGTINDWEGFQYFRNLVELDIWAQTTVVPVLPTTLRKLSIQFGAQSFTSLPMLPDGLTDLQLYNCIYLTSLPPSWPSGLLRLDINECRNISALPSLPASLISLKCRSNKLTSLPALPASLDTLDCSFNDSIVALPALPAGLVYFDCQVNKITSLGPTLPPALKWLNFNYNEVDLLPTLPPGIMTLYGVSNHLTTVPPFPASLLTIQLSVNNISNLPALPPGLTSIGVEGNQLSVLPTLPNTIVGINCGSNLLTSLPTLPTSLQSLLCYYNQLASLPALPPLLSQLECRGNQLTSLPDLPDTLNRLGCEYNQLTSLPALPRNLQWLHCNDNQLTYLPDFPERLYEVWCQHNLIHCLPVLHQHASIDMDNRINCMPNMPLNYVFTVYDTASFNTVYYSVGTGQNHFPLCAAVNNVYHCNAFPLMRGYVYNDNNNNNVRDANEPYRTNIRVSLSNGSFTTTDNNGFYEILADSIGAYSLTCNPPNYFAAVPPAYNFNFSTYDTLVINDFALQATATADSVAITITPQRWAARVGFPMPYDISYLNAGTTTLNPVIRFNYPNTQLNYDSSSNASLVNNGTYLQLNESAMVSGERRSFTAYFRTSITATLGDTIHVNALITANAATGTDSAATQIRGAYDPNDKSATPVLSPQQVADGDYINYYIRFQNTGNDTAFNVVLTDTLNSFLQPATFEMVNASHSCKTTVNGNVVTFEFLNILLPDSNINELKSHGFASFRIKPQNNVPLNSSIPNTAAIYFDYNLPVITNTALTQVLDPILVPLKLLSFTIEKKTNTTAKAYWTTSNEYNVRDFVIESGIDGRNYTAIASEPTKGNQYNSYEKGIVLSKANIVYYRLKVTDIDGRFYYGPVVILKMDIDAAGFSFINNPVKDVLNISVQDAALKNTTARIINSQGAVVQKIYLKNDTESINISMLTPGVYILETIKGSKQFIIK